MIDDRIEVRLTKAAEPEPKREAPREDAPIDDAKRMLARLTRDMRLADAELDRVHQASELIADHHRASAKRLRPHLTDLHDGPTADEYEDHLRNAFQADTLANDGEYLDRIEAHDTLAKAHQPSMFDPDLMPVQKTVRRATGTHTQTYHVRRPDPPKPIPQPASDDAPLPARDAAALADKLAQRYPHLEPLLRTARFVNVAPRRSAVASAEPGGKIALTPGFWEHHERHGDEWADHTLLHELGHHLSGLIGEPKWAIEGAERHGVDTWAARLPFGENNAEEAFATVFAVLAGGDAENRERLAAEAPNWAALVADTAKNAGVTLEAASAAPPAPPPARDAATIRARVLAIASNPEHEKRARATRRAAAAVKKERETIDRRMDARFAALADKHGSARAAMLMKMDEEQAADEEAARDATSRYTGLLIAERDQDDAERARRRNEIAALMRTDRPHPDIEITPAPGMLGSAHHHLAQTATAWLRDHLDVFMVPRPVTIQATGDAAYSYYKPRGHQIAINLRDNNPTASTIHEYAHHVEVIHPHLVDSAVEFIEQHTDASQPPINLGILAHNLDLLGVHLPAGPWIGGYASRIYRDSEGRAIATELFATGLQAMYEDPVGFAAKAPEHFEWTYRAMKGHDQDPSLEGT